RRIVSDGKGSAGKRLDFLMQEFKREANTLGSKAIAAECTLASVELKVLIEQMREQDQNIE
ncbi:endoribonuclease YicC domain-containing protein, partial [Neisseria sp. P0001.S004]